MPLTEKAKALIAKRKTERSNAPPISAFTGGVAKADNVSMGVYLNQERRGALVAHVGPRKVFFVTMMNGSIELLDMSRDRFVFEFGYRLEGYPMRRAARAYLESYLEKTDKAIRALRLIMAKG